MKIYIPLIVTAIVFIIAGCSKSTQKDSPIPVMPQISVQNINYPSFINSSWTQVTGGTLKLEFDLVNTQDVTQTSIKDSTSIANIGSYNKILTAGTYDITATEGNLTAVADTFLRFKAQIKSYAVSNKQAVSLTATTNDGLITIGKSFIQDNTVPTFKSDSSSKVYKLGLINGFYYLYVKGNTKGSISFISKTTGQSVTKSLNISALDQYNMAVTGNKASLQVVFVPFVYNQVAVSSSTLLTVNVNVGAIANGSVIYYIATDENGTILNEVTYIPGTTTFKISTLQPFQKTRFNLFVVTIGPDKSSVPNIIGYLQVKKGSVFNSLMPVLPYKTTSNLNIHLQNTTGFDKLNVSTSSQNNTIQTLPDTSNLHLFSYVDGDKLWVQRLKNNQYTYNFFDISKGSTDLNVDISKLTEIPQVKAISSPGTNLYVNLYAKSDTNYSDIYNFGQSYSASGSLNYYYPNESFTEYNTFISYSIGDFYYKSLTSGSTVPNSPQTIDATFNVSGSNLANFKPTVSGTFDFYHAAFLYSNSGPYLQVDLYSPSAANYTNIKLPDFSKYLGLTNLDISTQVLKYFELIQVSGFNESNFVYNSAQAGFTPNLIFKSIYKNY